MSNFSYYRGPVTNTTPMKDITMEKAIELIKSDEFKEKIIKIRSSENPHVGPVIKKNLDYFTFSGTFKKRVVKGLIKHSGLLCLDYDGLSSDKLKELYEKLPFVPEVHAFFTSPSGNGIKIVCKINPNHHELAFEQIPNYLQDNLDIPAVDPSGKDVARACFVSHDPNAYYNPKSKTFKCTNIKQPKKAVAASGAAATPVKTTEELSASARYDRENNLERVKYCIQQIENKQIDITDNDYDDRRDVGFALSTLGEDARELYHRAVQFNDAYDRKDADYKFTDALNNSVFKTPSKFFKLCKNHGILISRARTIDQAKEEAEVKDIIGDDQGTSDFINYGLWEQGQTYWSLDLKNKKRQVSNFLMKILYHVETTDEEAYRMIRIKNVFGIEKVIKINTDDFVSAGSFKKVIARKGNFIWLGQDQDLVRLQDKLQREERPTKLVATLGWNKRGGFYAFANGIYIAESDEFKDVDEYGIVEHHYKEQPQNYFIPAMSKIFADKDDQYTNDKKFRMIESEIGLNKWAAQFCRVFGDNGRVGIIFYIMSIFSDLIFAKANQRFPILYAYGKRGSGKGTMIQAMMRLFGEGQDQIMLGGASTVVGFMRKLAQYCNALVWMDEYKNNINLKMVESLKNIYDRKGYERGKKDNSFQTESTPIKSAAIISGQEMPTIEAALFTRCIQITFSETKRTESARELIRELTKMEDRGISHLTTSLLKYRPLFEESFNETYEQSIRDLANAVNNNEIDERMLCNYAMMIATCILISEHETLPFSVSQFQSQCKTLLVDQFNILRGSDDTSKFWSVIEQLAGTVLYENVHYQLKSGYIDIRVQDVYPHYNKALMDRRDPNILDKATLDNYLMSCKGFVKRHKSFFGKTQRWSLQFKYSDIGIDLIKAESQSDLKLKYESMGLATEEIDEAIKEEELLAKAAREADYEKMMESSMPEQLPYFTPNGVPTTTVKNDEDLPF